MGTDSHQSASVPSTLRLRSAGYGVVLGGVFLGVGVLVVPYALTAVGLIVGATVAGVAGRKTGTWFRQLCLGVGAVGLIALVEATTTVGVGLDPLELAALAVVFGLIDIVAGTVLHRVQSRTAR